METAMKTEQKRKKKKGKPERTAVWAGVICLLSVLAMGCGFRGGTAGAVEETDGAGDAVQKTETLKDTAGLEIPKEEAETGALTGTGEPEPDRDAGGMDRQPEGQENAGGRWHVLEPGIAAALDADFCGMVYRLDEDSFAITEEINEITEDGMSGSTLAVGVEVPDEDLIPVVFDGGTRFYTRTIYDGGARYEDAEAGFTDLEAGVSVEMKGAFEADVFYAEEIRIIKVV